MFAWYTKNYATLCRIVDNWKEEYQLIIQRKETNWIEFDLKRLVFFCTDLLAAIWSFVENISKIIVLLLCFLLLQTNLQHCGHSWESLLRLLCSVSSSSSTRRRGAVRWRMKLMVVMKLCKCPLYFMELWKFWVGQNAKLICKSTFLAKKSGWKLC